MARGTGLESFRGAGIAQLVEHNLAKVGVASSSLVSRSNPSLQAAGAGGETRLAG